MITAMIFCLILIIMTVVIHYEILGWISSRLLHFRIPSRARLLFAIFAIFVAHILEIWLYALAYFLLTNNFGLGNFGGQMDHAFENYLYFSTESYTSLGLGDIYPLGPLRLLTGTESLNGLLLIAWSASFAYLAMQKFWRLESK